MVLGAWVSRGEWQGRVGASGSGGQIGDCIDTPFLEAVAMTLVITLWV
jgi:hypothetical protein